MGDDYITGSHHLTLKKSTDIIYIDFAKAFDSISHSKLILKLKSYGLRGKLLSWITAWLSDRTQSVKIDHFFSFPKQVLSGILQGTVLRPLLFLIFINDLTDHIHPDAHPTLFADDLKIFSDQFQTSASFASGSLCSSSSLLQSTLNSIVIRSSTWQMTISIPKCSVLSISNSTTCVPRLYYISNTSLPQVTTFNDLGILIRQTHFLCSHPFFNQKSLFQIYPSFTLLFSRNPKLLTAAFTSYVRALLEYASPVWSPHLIKDIDAIEKVQRRFTKSFPNLRDLPYPIRIARLNSIPLSERRSNIDLITSYRILNNLVHHISFQFLTLRTHNLTRGHSLILSKPKVRKNVSKFSFYSRVVDPWNLLPDRVDSAGTLPTFKFLLKTLHL